MAGDSPRRGRKLWDKLDLLALAAQLDPGRDEHAGDLVRYLERLGPRPVEVGWPLAEEILHVWRNRYVDLDLESAWDGWSSFFETLASADGVIGFVPVRHDGPAQFLLILSARGDRILSILARRGREAI